MTQPERVKALAGHINEILTKLPNAYVGQSMPAQRGMWRQLELSAVLILENLCSKFDVSGKELEALIARSRRALGVSSNKKEA